VAIVAGFWFRSEVKFFFYELMGEDACR